MLLHLGDDLLVAFVALLTLLASSSAMAEPRDTGEEVDLGSFSGFMA